MRKAVCSVRNGKQSKLSPSSIVIQYDKWLIGLCLSRGGRPICPAGLCFTFCLFAESPASCYKILWPFPTFLMFSFFFPRESKGMKCFFTTYCPTKKSEAPSWRNTRNSCIEANGSNWNNWESIVNQTCLKLRFCQFSFPVSVLWLILLLKYLFYFPNPVLASF